MRMRLAISILLAIVMCAGVPLSAWADSPSLDITVDGPWIVYAKDTFINKDGTEAHVIVLMAPSAASSSMHWPHLKPAITEGDGYPIDPGIFCVEFDGKCAPPIGTSFTTGSYPAAEPLKVNVPTTWVWFKNRYDPYATYLILPMPNSYSNDGVWYMRFGSDFSADWHTYTYQPRLPPSIGIQLHYTSGATKLSLFECKISSSVVPGYDTCDKLGLNNGDLPNTGTLHITMKNRNFDDPCDPHVREAYPMMLNMLDNKPLGSTGTNVNKNIGYIDPAIYSSFGTVYYDDTADGSPCRDGDHDPQKPKSTSSRPSAARNKKAHAQAIPSEGVAEWTNAKLVAEIKEIAAKLQNPNYSAYKTELLSSAITSVASELNANSPTISQLSEAAELLRSSAAAAEKIGKSHHLDELTTLGKQEILVSDNTYTKDGKDCKAPIMLVQ